MGELTGEAVAICRGKRGDFLQNGDPAAHFSGEASMTDTEVQQELLCIHHPHKQSKIIRRYLAGESVVNVLTRVIGPNVKCMQSMLFIKSAGKPGQAWHQDEDFIPTRDRSLTGAWIAIDDATIDNGCLWVIPGSHKPGILWPMHAHTDARFDCTLESINFPYTDQDAVPVEVPAGSIVFFNGYLLHRSLPNKRRQGFRRVLVNHYMSAESLLPWRHVEGQSMALQDYRDIVLIAGQDPYAYKGFEDIARTHVRADGEGGCSDGRKLR
ncbi:MAG TPA: phytanoyl-CoA dioxygenase family protein [Oceanipulchritudo sp.]|nr:phytanoyl-CoA dioxygenase family protein [Oceanipulchritudo sp.]